MTAPDYAARAAVGAALLDEQVPGWAGEIDLSCLDLSSECGCVLGQLNPGGYSGMRGELGLEPARAVALGFTLSLRDPWGDWDRLDAAWAAEIVTRREAAEATS